MGAWNKDNRCCFSLLIFQDPVDPTQTAIVISSLVPGGVAELGGELFPGDRLVFVNEKYLHNATLSEAVEVLISAPPGNVRLGICKPLAVRVIHFILAVSGRNRHLSWQSKARAVRVICPYLEVSCVEHNGTYLWVNMHGHGVILCRLERKFYF